MSPSDTSPTCDRKDVSKCIFKDYTRRGDTCVAPTSSQDNYDAYSLANNYDDTAFNGWLDDLYNRNAGSDPNKSERSNVEEYRKRCQKKINLDIIKRPVINEII